MTNKHIIGTFVLVASCCLLCSQAFVVTRPPSSAIHPSTSLASWNKFVNRFDTIESAGFKRSCDSSTNNSSIVKTAGFSIKKVINPVTFLALSLLAGLKWRWCFRNPFYWFAVGFCIKWYRARYIFKIPVWDRQPNWNNVITSKEQEKELKAYTCKKCGSTLFIAKSREFFFQGETGLAGLGCFTCGAKGKENFMMDRDRIVEDVADLDDYFEYERPLDFVSRAERRDLLKLTEGDEEKANQILLDRANAAAGKASTPSVDAESVESAPEEPTEPESELEDEEQTIEPRAKVDADDTADSVDETNVTASDAINEETISPSPSAPPPVAENKPAAKVPDTVEKKTKTASKPLRPPPPPVTEEVDLSELDMDL